MVLGNWDLLLQVLDNLVGNGLKFTQSNGKLILRAYTWPDICVASPAESKDSAPHCEFISPLPKLRIEIADTGCGIDEANQQRIFDRFFRIENSVHTQVGTGLGLAIAMEIIEKHGGEIRVASELKVGTTFWFDLPLEYSDTEEILVQAVQKNQKRNSMSQIK